MNRIFAFVFAAALGFLSLPGCGPGEAVTVNDPPAVVSVNVDEERAKEEGVSTTPAHVDYSKQ